MSSRKILVSKGSTAGSRPDQSLIQNNPPITAIKKSATPWGNHFRATATTERFGIPAVSNLNTNSRAPDHRQSRYNPSEARGPIGNSVISGLPDLAKLNLNKRETLPPPGEVLDKKKYELGMIFWATQHEPKIEGAELESRYTTETQHGTICSKVRPMIVVALFDRHCVAVPLFTHNSRGLRGKKLDEYVTVRDPRLRGEVMPLSNHKPLLAGKMVEGSSIIKSESTAQLTYPVSVRYGSRIILWGFLDRDSLFDLQLMFEAAIPKVRRTT